MQRHISQRCAAYATRHVTWQSLRSAYQLLLDCTLNARRSRRSQPSVQPTMPARQGQADTTRCAPGCTRVKAAIAHRMPSAASAHWSPMITWKRRLPSLPYQCKVLSQGELLSLRNSLAEWQSISELAGVAEAFVMGPVTPAAIAGELVRARESEKQLQVRHGPEVVPSVT